MSHDDVLYVIRKHHATLSAFHLENYFLMSLTHYGFPQLRELYLRYDAADYGRLPIVLDSPTFSQIIIGLAQGSPKLQILHVFERQERATETVFPFTDDAILFVIKHCRFLERMKIDTVDRRLYMESHLTRRKWSMHCYGSIVFVLYSGYSNKIKSRLSVLLDNAFPFSTIAITTIPHPQKPSLPYVPPTNTRYSMSSKTLFLICDVDPFAPTGNPMSCCWILSPSKSTWIRPSSFVLKPPSCYCILMYNISNTQSLCVYVSFETAYLQSSRWSDGATA